MKAGEMKKVAGMSDAAVQAKTGKTWSEWFSILDKAGARNMNHRGIVAYLSQKHGVGPWWQQMVTVAYERARGKRQTHERPEGFEVSASKTITAPLGSLYRAWTDPKLSKRWLPDAKFAISKATPNKSVRIAWGDGTSRVDVMFYPRGAQKNQVTVQHRKLENAADAKRIQSYWKDQLEKLAALLKR